MSALAPRIVERRGVPSHPGRARLLRFPRPVESIQPQRGLRPHTKDLLAISAFAAVCSGLLVAAGASELHQADRERHAVIEEANEHLDKLLEQYQCELLHVEADQLLEPGERWPALRDALTPEMRAWCRGER